MDSNPQQKNLIITAGGTGGHVFPALAVAQQLRQQGYKVTWVGTRSGIEADVVPKAGFDIEFIDIKGLRGKKIIKLLQAPWQLLRALWQSYRLIKKIKPQFVLGMGGYVSGPVGLATFLNRRPLIIHEQNAIPGLTNKILSRIARKTLSAFPSAFNGAKKNYCLGNPVRQEIIHIARAEQRYQDRRGALRVLVLGGSLGAKAINDIVPAALAEIPAARRPQVKHQAGAKQLTACQQNYQNHQVDAEVLPFIDDMAEALAWADLVICRAGAMTISELAAAGVPAVLVPFPYAVDDHQFYNAQYLAQAKAAFVVRQNDFSVDYLKNILQQLADDRGQLLNMAQAAYSLAKIDATDRIVEHCLSIL